MNKSKITGQRLLVLDTNILMHDPNAIFRFDEHDLFLPMIVLEELDAYKRGITEVSRNVRQVNRLLDSMVSKLTHAEIMEGVPIPKELNMESPIERGRLFFQVHDCKVPLPISLPGSKADNNILAICLALQSEYSDRMITLISKDINLRIK